MALKYIALESLREYQAILNTNCDFIADTETGIKGYNKVVFASAS
jgi:hypothetical protein